MDLQTNDDRALGLVFGTAIGDALGAPVEFMRMEQIRARYGPRGIQELPTPAEYTDDTQMFLATLEGLLKGGCDATLDEAGAWIADAYTAWSVSPENNRAPGNACMTGCLNLQHGVPWHESGVPNAKGCGTAMRSMAYGLWFAGAPEKAAEWAASHAVMTHRSDEAMASAAAVAAGCAELLLADTCTARFSEVVVEAARAFDLATGNLLLDAFEFAERSHLAVAMAEDSMPSQVLDRWSGWRGREAVAAAVYCFMRHLGDYEACVREAANSPGDSDSLACIAGAFCGSLNGAGRIPERWKQTIENGEQLALLPGRVRAAWAG